MGSNRVCHAFTRRRCRQRPCQWAPQTAFRLKVVWGCCSLTLWYAPRVGYKLDTLEVVGTDGSKQMTDYRAEELEMKRREAPTGAPQDGPDHLAPPGTKLLLKLPHLVAHCSVNRYEDGTPRQPGWFTVKTYGSQWTVLLKDPDTGTQVQCSGPSLDETLLACELLVSSDKCPWEADPYAKQKGKKKVG